jgi:hypothetical protein
MPTMTQPEPGSTAARVHVYRPDDGETAWVTPQEAAAGMIAWGREPTAWTRPASRSW